MKTLRYNQPDFDRAVAEGVCGVELILILQIEARVRTVMFDDVHAFVVMKR